MTEDCHQGKRLASGQEVFALIPSDSRDLLIFPVLLCL